MGVRPRLVSRLQRIGDQIVRQPERRARVNRIRREIGAVVSIPRTAAPTPAVRDGPCPRVIRPSIESRPVVGAREVRIHVDAVEVIASVEGVIVVTVGIVGALGVFVAIIPIGVLHIAVAPVADEDAGVIAALDDHDAGSAEPVVDIHAVPVVVERGDSSIRPAHHGAISGLNHNVAVRGCHAMSVP